MGSNLLGMDKASNGLRTRRTLTLCVIVLAVLVTSLGVTLRHHRGHGTILPMVLHPVEVSEIKRVETGIYRIGLPYAFADKNAGGYDAFLLQNGEPLGEPKRTLYELRAAGAVGYVFSGYSVFFTPIKGTDPLRDNVRYAVRWPMPVSDAIANLTYVLAFILICLSALGTAFLRFDALERLRTAGRISIYVAASLCIYAAATYFLIGNPTQKSVGLRSEFPGRVTYYQRNTGKYDTVFLGDSRTFCGIHPDLVDPLLNTRSINLASFSNWFPTQFAELTDLLEVIPPETTVVWSIGAINFNHGSIRRVYPMSIRDALALLKLGFSVDDLVDNLSWSLVFSTWLGQLYDQRANFRDGFFDSLEAPSQSGLFAHADARSMNASVMGGDIDAEEAQALKDKYARIAGVQRIDVIADDGKINSVALIREGGTYYRIELDPDYFRLKQQNMPPTETRGVYASEPDWQPDPRYVALFEKMLDLFNAHDVKVVVNIMEEAPHVYRNEASKAYFRAFIDNSVAPMVMARGFPVVRADFDDLTDSDYFDYNHLNSKGISKYTPMLAELLRPYVVSAGKLN